MLIKELQLKKDIQTLKNPEDILKKYGWKVLGIGMEAAVAEHPNKNYVLKLFDDDSNYKNFVQFAVDHKGNPHVPVFFRGSETKDLTKIDERSNVSIPGLMSTIPGTDLSYVRMEKLSKISENDLIKLYAPEMLVLYLDGIKENISGLNYELKTAMRKKIIVAFRLFSGTKSSNTDFIEKLAHDHVQQVTLWKQIGREPDEAWYNVAQDLITMSKHLGTRELDIHEENVMLRGNTLVITDPFY
jgi:hypothetical protein